MIISELIEFLDKTVKQNHDLPGYLEQEVEVVIRWPEADLHFGLTAIETPRKEHTDFPRLHFIVQPMTKEDVANQNKKP